MTSFDDKVAIVTGTSLGVGIACDLTVAGASRRAGEPASRVAQMAISHPHGVNHELRALV